MENPSFDLKQVTFLSGLNNLYPGDIIPFTRRPLFLIIDSDNSDAFKAGLSNLVFCLVDILLYKVPVRCYVVAVYVVLWCSDHVNWRFVLRKMTSDCQPDGGPIQLVKQVPYCRLPAYIG